MRTWWQFFQLRINRLTRSGVREEGLSLSQDRPEYQPAQKVWLSICDSLLLTESGKLSLRYIGLYEIGKIINPLWWHSNCSRLWMSIRFSCLFIQASHSQHIMDRIILVWYIKLCEHYEHIWDLPAIRSVTEPSDQRHGSCRVFLTCSVHAGQVSMRRLYKMWWKLFKVYHP